MYNIYNTVLCIILPWYEKKKKSQHCCKGVSNAMAGGKFDTVLSSECRNQSLLFFSLFWKVMKMQKLN